MPKIVRAGMGYVRKVDTKRSGTKYQPCYKQHGALRTGGTYAKEQEAWDWLRDEEAKIRTGKLLDPTGQKRSLRTVAEAWLASNPNKSGTTVDDDTGFFERDILPVLGNRAIGSIDTQDVQSLVNSWIAERKPDGTPLANGTIWRRFAPLAAVMAFAVDRHWRIGNPAIANNRRRSGGINMPPRLDNQVRRYEPTIEDWENIEAAMPVRLMAFPWIGAQSGLRRNQILGLQLKDCDLNPENGYLHSRQGVVKVKGADGKVRPTLTKPGSTKAPTHTVSIDGATVETIKAHIEMNGITDPETFLFTTSAGTLYNPDNASKAWKRAVKLAGLGDIKPAIGTHDMRRFMLRTGAAAGVPIVDLQKRAHHSDIRLTARYIQTSPEADRRASDAIAAAMVRTVPNASPETLAS